MADQPTVAELIAAAEAKYGLPAGLLSKVISAESSGRPDAVSSAGAQGLGQLMPETAKSFGVTDPFDPEQNIDASARYLQQGLTKYGGDQTKALEYYYGGPNEQQWGSKTAAYPAKVLGGNPLTGDSVQVANGSLGPQLTALGASLIARANPLTQPQAVSNTMAAPVPLANDPTRLMQALQLTQLINAGTHSVQPVDYDPFKLEPHADGVTAVTTPTPDIRKPSTASGEPKVQAVDAVGGTSPGSAPGYLTFLGSRQFWGPQQGIEGEPDVG